MSSICASAWLREWRTSWPCKTLLWLVLHICYGVWVDTLLLLSDFIAMVRKACWWKQQSQGRQGWKLLFATSNHKPTESYPFLCLARAAWYYKLQLQKRKSVNSSLLFQEITGLCNVNIHARLGRSGECPSQPGAALAQKLSLWGIQIAHNLFGPLLFCLKN